MQIQSLVEELKSYKPRGMAKKEMIVWDSIGIIVRSFSSCGERGASLVAEHGL